MPRFGVDELGNQRYLRARELIDAGRIEEALELFESVLKSVSDPVDRAYPAYGVAKCLWKMGRKEEARKHLQEIIGGLPEGHFGRLDLQFINARWYWEEGKFEEALQILDSVLPRSREYLDVPEGQELYRDIQVSRGILLAEFERSREAIPVLEETLSLDLWNEQRAEVLYHLGICYYDLENRDLAKEKIQAAIQAGLQNSWAVRAHHYLGLIHFQNRAYAWAKQEFEFSERHADEVGFSRKAVLDMLCHTCRRLGLHDEAERYAALARQD